MRLGGVILASVGIIIVVLVANGRWSSVWAAALATPGASTTSSTTANLGSTTTTATGGGW